jgi:hypothetical protein
MSDRLETFDRYCKSATMGSIILATTLAANFADADSVDSIPVDSVTTTKT